jgi:hypothetical protein
MNRERRAVDPRVDPRTHRGTQRQIDRVDRGRTGPGGRDRQRTAPSTNVENTAAAGAVTAWIASTSSEVSSWAR